MELLLNILWLMLALPAIWIWRQEPARLAASRGFGRCRLVLLLGCILILLFPVVSATDDLHAMRPEIEESNFKRSVKQLGGERSAGWLSLASSFLVTSLSPVAFRHSNEVSGRVVAVSFLPCGPNFFSEIDSRPPPVSFLG